MSNERTPKFVNKDGFLTLYSFACGYIETNEGWKDKRQVCLSLVNNELRLFELVVYDQDERIITRDNIVNLLPARKAFKEACATVGCRPRRNMP